MANYDTIKMIEAIETLDTDKDGKISIEEFEYFLNVFGE